MPRVAMFALLLLFACGDDVGTTGKTVGGACTENGDCDTVCLTTGDFPGGTCSRTCASDDDCPSDTRCVKEDAQTICLLACEAMEDCREGYACKAKESVPMASSESLVCIDD